MNVANNRSSGDDDLFSGIRTYCDNLAPLRIIHLSETHSPIPLQFGNAPGF